MKVNVSALPKVTLRHPVWPPDPNLDVDVLDETPARQRRSFVDILRAGQQAVDRRSDCSMSSCHVRPLPFPFRFRDGDLDLAFALFLPLPPDSLWDFRCSNGQFFPCLHVHKG